MLTMKGVLLIKLDLMTLWLDRVRTTFESFLYMELWAIIPSSRFRIRDRVHSALIFKTKALLIRYITIESAVMGWWTWRGGYVEGGCNFEEGS